LFLTVLVYVNHRPYIDVTQDDINKALSKVMEGSDISQDKLQRLLQQYGKF
jgi:CBS-domain-containing membrane protein